MPHYVGTRSNCHARNSLRQPEDVTETLTEC